MKNQFISIFVQVIAPTILLGIAIYVLNRVWTNGKKSDEEDDDIIN